MQEENVSSQVQRRVAFGNFFALRFVARNKESSHKARFSLVKMCKHAVQFRPR